MAEEIDFENRQIWHLTAIPLSSEPRDGHVSRDTRGMVVDSDSPYIALSGDT